jgi:hypothetical protein
MGVTYLALLQQNMHERGRRIAQRWRLTGRNPDASYPVRDSAGPMFVGCFIARISQESFRQRARAPMHATRLDQPYMPPLCRQQ